MTDAKQTYTDSQGGLWHLSLDPKPIPTSAFDAEAIHDEYDGAPDSGFDLAVYAPTVDELPARIEQWIVDFPEYYERVRAQEEA